MKNLRQKGGFGKMREGQLNNSNKEIIIEEYRSLQEEHRKNREYIFERPLVVVTILAAIAQYILIYESPDKGLNLMTSSLKLLTFPFLIYMLYYNLTFTKDKLRSDARIVTYIQLFFEDNSVYWIGWETSLRYHRKWTRETKKIVKDIDKWLEQKIEKEYVYHETHWFYRKIYSFHIFLIFVLLFMWILATLFILSYLKSYYFLLFFPILALVRASYYFSKVTNSEHYSNYENLIEKERTKWLYVYNTEIFPIIEERSKDVLLVFTTK